MIIFLLSVSIKYLYFPIAGLLFIHELEEWNIYKYHKSMYSNTNQNESNLSNRLWLLFLSVVGLLLSTICYNIENLFISAMIYMFLVDFILLNSIQHILLSLKTKKYNPGFVFGGIFSFIVSLLFIYKIIAFSIIPLWIISIFLLAVIIALIETILSAKKNKLPYVVVQILRFSRYLEKIIAR